MTRIAVVGDALLDVDLVGEAQRLCPDAPVPVVDDVTEHVRPGGAALAACLAALHGADVSLVTPLADDEPAARLRQALQGLVAVCAVPCNGSTPVKQRIRAGGQSIARLDSGNRPTAVGEPPEAAMEALRSADAVLVSDYGRGAAAQPGIRRLMAELRRHAPVIWDPHPRGAEPVAGVHLATPNSQEATAWVQRIGQSLNGAHGWAATAQEADALLQAWGAGAVAITLGADGALLSYGHGAPMMLTAPRVAGGDSCGAGDAFAAAATTLLGSGWLTSNAVQEAVIAATRFVEAGGAASVTTEHGPPIRRTSPAPQRQFTAGDDAIAVAEKVRAQGGVVVATGGCFDLLHAGHVACLQAARRLGDALVVCLNSDTSVRRLKGAARPVVPADDRARILQALECVDAVMIFDEDTPLQVLRRIRPDVWAKGGDYAGAALPEEPVVAEWGGQVVTLPYVDGRSTSALVRAAALSSNGGSPAPSPRRDS